MNKSYSSSLLTCPFNRTVRLLKETGKCTVNALNRGTNNVFLFIAPHKLLPTRNWPVTLLPWDLSLTSGTEH